MKNLLCVILAGAAMALGVLTAKAQSVGNYSNTTSFSGYSNGQRITLGVNSTDNAVLYAITARERRDDPCFIRLHFRHPVTGNETRTRTFDDCEGNPGNTKFIRLDRASGAQKIRVCRKGNKIKGIELRGDFIGCEFGNSSLIPANRSCQVTRWNKPYFERTNCPGTDRGPDANWETNAPSCPSGTMATGAVLNVVNSSGGRRMINGIALRCHFINPA